MTSRELQRLGRRELLELLVQQERENEELRGKIAELEEQVTVPAFDPANAGTLAEAMLSLNGVFESADRAAAQYIETLKSCSEKQQQIYDAIVAEAEKKAKEILESAETEKKQRLKVVDDYWDELSGRLESFYQSHEGLKELLDSQPDIDMAMGGNI